MTNVLPVETQKKLWNEHRARFIIAWSIMFGILSIAAILTLVPSYIAIKLALASPDSTAQASTAAEETRILTKAQERVTAIAPTVFSTSSPTMAIQKALALRPKGVIVDHVRFSRGAASQISLAGSAGRDQINAYRTALQGETSFSSVTVPVGALVGAQDGRFSITITGQF